MATPLLEVDATRARVMRMIVTLAELLGEEMSADRAAGYAEALSDIPLDDLRLGVQRIVRNASYFPRPAEIRMAVERERDAREPTVVAPEIVCTRCDDSGWVIVKERTNTTQPTAARCACYRTNPKLVARSRLVISDGKADRENWR